MANSAPTKGRASGKSDGTTELPKLKTRGAQGAQSNQELKPKGLVPDAPEKGRRSVQHRASLFPRLGTGIPERGGQSGHQTA